MSDEAETSDNDRLASAAAGGGKARVLDWEIGLPSADDLTPLSQSLIPPELAFAFSISPEASRSLLDVHHASHDTVSSLRLRTSSTSDADLESFPPFPFPPTDDPMVLEEDDPASKDETAQSSRKVRRSDARPAASFAMEEEISADDHSPRTLKRQRLVWTPQLHKKFVDVVADLGMKNAVPKMIMQMMNVDGLTRENVASHLQKYRQYLKKVQGMSNEGPSSSDHLFALMPVPKSLHEPAVSRPMPYAGPAMIPMPVFGMPHHGHSGPVGIVSVNNHSDGRAYRGFESYSAFREPPNNWSCGNNFGQMASYPRVAPTDK